MLKLLLSLQLIAVPASFAAAPQFGLNAVNLPALRALHIPPPPAVTVPLRVRDGADPLPPRYFNAYVLKAIDYLRDNYGLLGYDISSILTHDIEYHTYGTIPARNAPLTMCVAAQMEIILTAFDIYARETGDYSVYDYLPKRSFEGLRITDIKGHIWVNHEFKSYGTADALINFGMGERKLFSELVPGDFVNINRTTRTGHAVAFIGYISKTGKMLKEYGPDVVGFKYFSSQGRKEAGKGGFDYRYAVFSQHGCPSMPYLRDCNVIYSERQDYLNTGRMLAPAYWTGQMPLESGAAGETSLDRNFFNGITTDD